MAKNHHEHDHTKTKLKTMIGSKLWICEARWWWKLQNRIHIYFLLVSRQFENTKSNKELRPHDTHSTEKYQRILLTRRLSVHACSLHSINRQWFGRISPRLMQPTSSSLNSRSSSATNRSCSFRTFSNFYSQQLQRPLYQSDSRFVWEPFTCFAYAELDSHWTALHSTHNACAHVSLDF